MKSNHQGKDKRIKETNVKEKSNLYLLIGKDNSLLDLINEYSRSIDFKYSPDRFSIQNPLPAQFLTILNILKQFKTKCNIKVRMNA